MAKIDDLNTKIDNLSTLVTTIKAGLDGIQTEVQALISGGNGATAAQLDALGAKIDTITTNASADIDEIGVINPPPSGATPPPAA